MEIEFSDVVLCVIALFTATILALAGMYIMKMTKQSKDFVDNLPMTPPIPPLLDVHPNSVTEKWKETLPKQSTRIKNRNKRKRK